MRPTCSGRSASCVDSYPCSSSPRHRWSTVEEGAEVIVRYALIPIDGPTGGFFDRDGAEPW